jgi:hypothetical protein
MCCNHYVHQQPVETTREHRAQNHDRTKVARGGAMPRITGLTDSPMTNELARGQDSWAEPRDGGGRAWLACGSTRQPRRPHDWQ